MIAIDLNCDMGELPELVEDGTQERLLRWVSSINVACGGHAGDEGLMEATIRAAQRQGADGREIRVGAHPGFPDREHFGRIAMAMDAAVIADTVAEQVERLTHVAERCGVEIRHGKAHGALYNLAAKDSSVARAVAVGFARCLPGIPLMGLAGSVMLEVFAEEGFPALPEAFVDRRYEADGSLRARHHPDAVIHEPGEAAQQAVQIATKGTVHSWDGMLVPVRARSLCIHSDSMGSPSIAEAVRSALGGAGISVDWGTP